MGSDFNIVTNNILYDSKPIFTRFFATGRRFGDAGTMPGLRGYLTTGYAG